MTSFQAILFILFMLFSVTISSNEKDYRDIRELFFPADEGTKREAALVKYIESFCVEQGIRFKTKKIESTQTVITSSVNVELSFDPETEPDASPETEPDASPDASPIILFINLNPLLRRGLFHDNSVSISAGLMIASRLNREGVSVPIRIVFSGCNGVRTRGLRGISDYLKNSEDKNQTVVFLNVLSSADKLKLTGSYRKRIFSSDLLKIFNRLDKNDLSIKYDAKYTEQVRLNFLDTGIYSDVFNGRHLAVFETNLIPQTNNFIYSSGFDRQLAELVYEFIGEIAHLKGRISEQNNYIFVDLRLFKVIIDEVHLLVLLTILIALGLLFREFSPGARVYRLSIIVKIIPSVIAFFIAAYIFSFIPFGLAYFIGRIYKIENLYLSVPFVYCLATVVVSFLCLSLINDTTRAGAYIKNIHYYGFVAVFVTVVLLIFSMIVNITLTPAYFVMLIFLLLSRFSRNTKVKVVLYIFASIPLVWIAFVFTSYYNIDEIHDIISNPIYANLVILAVSFPIYLIALRINLMFWPRTRIKKKYKKLILILVVSVMYILISVMNIVSLSDANAVTTARMVHNKIDNTCKLFLRTEKKETALLYRDIHGSSEKIRFSGAVTRDILFDYDPLTITLRRKYIDNYYKLYITVESDSEPEYFNLYMRGIDFAEPLESNYRFSSVQSIPGVELSANESAFLFSIPRNPSGQFVIELSLYEGDEYSFIYIAEYLGLAKSFELINEDNSQINKRYIYIGGFDLTL